jgi:hypothetical protein
MIKASFSGEQGAFFYAGNEISSNKPGKQINMQATNVRSGSL